jgi:tRNA threonylcarbamoyladenosine biosynthesis protein TsaE
VKAVTASVEETRELGAALAGVLAAGDAVMLAGDLGTGKTALVQGVARGLGVDDVVASPTFMIVREYEGRLPLVHVDVYRLDRVQELHDLGFEEVLAPEAVTVVEWGDRIAPVLPDERLEVVLEREGGPDDRSLTFTVRGPSWDARAGEIEQALDAWRRG